MLTQRENEIIQLLRKESSLASKEIHNRIEPGISYATVKRLLSKLTSKSLIEQSGRGKGTKYSVSVSYEILLPVDVERYYAKEIDEREIKDSFNLFLISETLPSISLFTQEEKTSLDALQKRYERNIANLAATEYKKELERLAIDLSWKSSQIEGNTYSLLETERLLKEKETASGKTKEEAAMLLNHKEAIDFIVEHPDYLVPLTVSKTEDIHSILIKELGVEKNLRKRRVGISGTNYRPLDNEFQIEEAMQEMCELINHKENVFEKALLALVLISYIQPFADGNKRTARIVSNALLMHYHYCPVSFRTVDSVEYKKAMLLFYEQNTLAPFKKIFIEQFQFAVDTYF